MTPREPSLRPLGAMLAFVVFAALGLYVALNALQP